MDFIFLWAEKRILSSSQRALRLLRRYFFRSVWWKHEFYLIVNYELFISVIHAESIENWYRKPLYYTFNILKNPMNPFGLLNMEYYYDERQAPVARGVHLVTFSKSFQWNSIHLLFRTFRQEISVTVVKVSRVVLEVNSVEAAKDSYMSVFTPPQ